MVKGRNVGFRLFAFCNTVGIRQFRTVYEQLFERRFDTCSTMWSAKQGVVNMVTCIHFIFRATESSGKFTCNTIPLFIKFLLQ